MDSIEILVHIAAPSLFKDDKRYLAQANSILHFVSVTRICVKDLDQMEEEISEDSSLPIHELEPANAISDNEALPAAPESSDEFPASIDGWSGLQRVTPRSAANQDKLHSAVVDEIAGPARNVDEPLSTAVSETPLLNVMTKLIKGHVDVVVQEGRQLVRPLRKPGFQIGTGRSTSALRRPRRLSSTSLSKPFRVPLLRPRQSESTIEAVRTPDAPRPRTAPAADSSREYVPETVFHSHKRTRSDPSTSEAYKRARIEDSSFEAALRAVPCSQPEPRSDTTALDSSGSSAELLPCTAPERKAEGANIAAFGKPIISVERGHRLAKRRQSYGSPLRQRDGRTVIHHSGSTTEPFSSSASDVTRNVVTTARAQISIIGFAAPARPVKRQHRAEKETSCSSPVIDETPSASKDRPRLTSLQSPSVVWTSSSAPPPADQTSTSLATTETASQLTPRALSPSTTPPPEALHQNPSSPIDLISQELASSQLSSPQSSATRRQPVPCTSPSDSVARCLLYPAIDGLPISINPLPPPTGHGSLGSHVTPYLAKLYLRFPSEKHFRPGLVTRDISNCERGYWQIVITLVPDDIVTRLRADKTEDEKRSQISDVISSRDKSYAGRLQDWRVLKKQISKGEYKLEELDRQKEGRCLWKESEFMNFWQDLQTSVQVGNLGHSIRVARLSPEDDDDNDDDAIIGGSEHSPELEASKRRIVLKVFTWGEVVYHIYAHLWLMSDKKIAYQPLEWCDSNDVLVVRMTGERWLGGNLGKWTYKGPIGKGKGNEKGVWGIVPYARREPPSKYLPERSDPVVADHTG